MGNVAKHHGKKKKIMGWVPPPVDRQIDGQTRVKTLPSRRTTYAGGNNCKTALMYAAKGGHKDCVATLLQWGAAVNVWDDKHEATALMYVAKNTTAECTDLLIEAGADVNQQDKQGRTPLMYAATAGNFECVDSLLLKGIDVNKMDNNKMMAIDYAARYGQHKFIEKLIHAGSDVHHTHDGNFTTLMSAAIKGSYKCVEKIIQAGADVNIATSCSGTALCFAAYELEARPEKIECMKLMLAAAADVNYCDNNGSSVLHFAAKSGHVEGIQFLLKEGANVNASDQCGNTVLMSAAGSGHDSYLEFMMHEALDMLSIHGGYELLDPGDDMVGCVKIILQSGALVNRLNSFRQNALKYHVANGDPISREVAMLLFAAGETIDEDTVFRTTRTTRMVPVQVPDYLVRSEVEELRLVPICRAALRRYMLKASPVNLCCRVPQLGLPSMLIDYLLYDMSIYN